MCMRRNEIPTPRRYRNRAYATATATGGEKETREFLSLHIVVVHTRTLFTLFGNRTAARCIVFEIRLRDVCRGSWVDSCRL